LADFNQTTIIGRLGQDPEMKTTESGIKWARLSVAVSKTWKDKSGTKKEKTYWYPVVAYDKRAEYIVNNAKKGSVVFVQGEMGYNEKENVKYWALTANNIQIISGYKEKDSGGSHAGNDEGDGFIPET
jgi:single-strand DNA-binding protein